jgi:hypothetical protein
LGYGEFGDWEQWTGGYHISAVSTHGSAAFKTVFVPAAMREAFNASAPQNDVANWSSLVPDALTSTDSGGDTIDGRYDLLNSFGLFSAGVGAPATLPRTFTNTNVRLLRNATLPDVQRLNITLDPSNLAVGATGLQNGRRPGDDAVDVLLRLVRQLADIDFMGSNVRPSLLQFPLQNLALPTTDRRVLLVLQGTDFIRPDSTLSDLTQSGNDRPLLNVFPFEALLIRYPARPRLVLAPSVIQFSSKTGAKDTPASDCGRRFLRGDVQMKIKLILAWMCGLILCSAVHIQGTPEPTTGAELVARKRELKNEYVTCPRAHAVACSVYHSTQMGSLSPRQTLP